MANICCLGDSHIEMEAACLMSKYFCNALLKTVKFKEHPRPDELVKQHSLVSSKFSQIYLSVRNLSIRLEKKTKQSPDTS